MELAAPEELSVGILGNRNKESDYDQRMKTARGSDSRKRCGKELLETLQDTGSASVGSRGMQEMPVLCYK